MCGFMTSDVSLHICIQVMPDFYNFFDVLLYVSYTLHFRCSKRDFFKSNGKKSNIKW